MCKCLHTRGTISTAVALSLVVLAVLAMLDGIASGLNHNWMRMSLALFVSGLLIFFAVSGVTAIVLNTSLKRLEARFLGEHSAQGRAASRAGHRMLVLMVLSVPICLSCGYGP